MNWGVTYFLVDEGSASQLILYSDAITMLWVNEVTLILSEYEKLKYSETSHNGLSE